jgi:hypothetical protein
LAFKDHSWKDNEDFQEALRSLEERFKIYEL